MVKAKYQQIADDIREKIMTEEYQLHEAIPSENQLQQNYQVSRHTIREAIALLVKEGYLRKEKGSGTYVSDAYKTRTMAASEKKTIGVITTYLSDYIFPSIIRGIEKELRENGYSLLLASTNNNPQQERECLLMMMNQGVQGLIIEPTKSNQYNPNLSYYLEFKEKGIPMVMINAYYEELDIPHICVNDTRSGYLTTKYLFQQGHQTIAMITKIDDLQGKYRMKGFIKAHEEAQSSSNPAHIYTYTTETKHLIVQEVLAQLPEIEASAFVCYNDEIANQLVQGISSLGKKVPEDYSVIGEDDSFLSTAGEVRLTTTSHPKEEMGKDAAKWIVQAVTTKKDGSNIFYEPEIIVRDSVKKVN